MPDPRAVLDPGAGDPLSPRRILVPIDFADGSRAALRFADALAEAHGAEILLLHVVDPRALGQTGGSGRGGRAARVPRSILVDCELHLRELRDRETGIHSDSRILVRRGDPRAEILRLAREAEVQLIVLTATAEDVDERPRGGTAEAVVRRAPCPVLTLRPDLWLAGS